MGSKWKNTIDFLLEYEVKSKHLGNMKLCPLTWVFRKSHMVLTHAFPWRADILTGILIEMMLMRLKLLTGKDVGEKNFHSELVKTLIASILLNFEGMPILWPNNF